MSKNKMLGIPLSEEDLDLLDKKFQSYKEESGMETENFTNWARCILLNHSKTRKISPPEEGIKTLVKEFLMDEEFKKYWGLHDARPI